jgi:delta-lactam-biosynthetic de-N-acetylase
MGRKKNKTKTYLSYGILILTFSVLVLVGVVADKNQTKAIADLPETDIAKSSTEETDLAAAEAKDMPLAASAENENTTTEQIQGQILTNTPIEDVTSLDTTVQNWGLGKARDDLGRPVDAVNVQDQYGGYQALFLGEGENSVYLTFDEGYENGFTENLLDTLQAKDVKAVFFITEYYAKSQPELVQRMIDEGHVIGNHSATHPSAGMTSLSLEEQYNEVMENHEYVLEQFNYHMYLFRYPSGSFNEQSLAVVNNCNYKSVFWSFAYVDYDVNNQPDPAESLAKMEERLHPGAIYLLHAESSTNATILGEFIDAIRERGYRLDTL